MTTFRVAVIGAGSRAYSHADAYQHINNAKLCACADFSIDRREKFAAQYGVNGYSSAVEMIEKEKPDLVHIVTPPSVRFEVMKLVSDLGVKACTVEKPVALGVDDWRALGELEKVSATRFGVCHQFRWYASLQRCREALASGALGKILMIDASAGMDVTNQGTHSLHYGNSLNGDQDVVEVFGAASGWDRGDLSHPGPETTTGTLKFVNGVRLLWNTGPTAPRVGDPTTTWQHVRVAAYAEKGRVLWEEFGKWEIVGPDGVQGGEFEGFDAWISGNRQAQAGFHRDMLTWIEDDAKPVGTNLARSLHEWKAVLALYASALSRQPIDMRTFEPQSDLVSTLEKALTAGR